MLNISELLNKNAKRINAREEVDNSEATRINALDKKAKKKKEQKTRELTEAYYLTMANAELDVIYLTQALGQLSRYVLKLEGVDAPEDKTKIGDYLRQVDEVTNESGLRPAWALLKEEQKPVDLMGAIKEAKEQEEREKAEAKAAAEASKPKGKRAGKVTTSKIKDDGSEAEAASECKTVAESVTSTKQQGDTIGNDLEYKEGPKPDADTSTNSTEGSTPTIGSSVETVETKSATTVDESPKPADGSVVDAAKSSLTTKQSPKTAKSAKSSKPKPAPLAIKPAAKLKAVK